MTVSQHAPQSTGVIGPIVRTLLPQEYRSNDVFSDPAMALVTPLRRALDQAKRMGSSGCEIVAWGFVNGQVVDPIGFLQVTNLDTVIFSFFNPQEDDNAIKSHRSTTAYVRQVAGRLTTGDVRIEERRHFVFEVGEDDVFDIVARMEEQFFG